ncbi:MAG: EamA family transporter [Bacteroidales bacterium]|nr:EamA family transporter [Bacteroidales bacterium]
MNTKKQQTLSWFILTALVLVWGSSFILIKKSLLYFTAPEVGFLRIVITFLFLSPLVYKRLKKIDRKYFWLLTVSGIIGSLLPALLFAISETGIDSAIAGTLNSLTPLFTLLIGLMFFKFRTRWYNVLGVIVGLLGAVGLIMANSGGAVNVDIFYASLVVIASLLYAINVNIVKSYFHGISSLDITVLSFFFIGLPVLVYIALFSRIPQMLWTDARAWEGIGYLSILAVLGTGVALIAYNQLIKWKNPVFASSVTYLIPIVAILWGVLDGEKFTLTYVLWILLILAGVFLVNARPYAKLNLATRILFWKK